MDHHPVEPRPPEEGRGGVPATDATKDTTQTAAYVRTFNLLLRLREHSALRHCIVAFGIWLMAASGALAEWRIQQFTDRTTGEVAKLAFVPAKEPSGGVRAGLVIRCTPGVSRVFPTALYLWVLLSKKMPEGTSIAWRVDESRPQHQYMPELGRTSSSALNSLPPEALRGAKLIRLRWVALKTGTTLFYEFNVTGANKAIAQIPCATSAAN